MPPRSRSAVIAVIAAGLALVVAVVAVVVVVTRAPPAPRGILVDDGEITAADLVALYAAPREQARNRLDLGPDGRLISIDGVPVDDVDALDGLAASPPALAGRAKVVYFEIERGGVPVVVRRTITGDLKEAWKAAHPPPPPPPTLADLGIGSADPDPAAADQIAAAVDTGIIKVDDTTYELARDLVDKVLANPTALAKGARVMPAVKNGQPDGFKLYAIRPNSVFSKLGLTNGDTIQRINGHDLSTADQALATYQDLKGATKVVVDVVRRGKPVTLTYSIK